MFILSKKNCLGMNKCLCSSWLFKCVKIDIKRMDIKENFLTENKNTNYLEKINNDKKY